MRRKPRHVRERVATIAAGSFTAVVFVIWIFTTPGQMETEEGNTERTKAFATFIGQVKEQMAGVRDSVPEEDVAPLKETLPTETPVMLDASSTRWSLSSSTVADKRIEKEVPIIVVPSSSTSRSSSTPPVR